MASLVRHMDVSPLYEEYASQLTWATRALVWWVLYRYCPWPCGVHPALTWIELAESLACGRPASDSSLPLQLGPGLGSKLMTQAGRAEQSITQIQPLEIRLTRCIPTSK
ncbi:hypothetical protein V2G26_006874 [Clonostachys chloroleuca]